MIDLLPNICSILVVLKNGNIKQVQTSSCPSLNRIKEKNSKTWIFQAQIIPMEISIII